ncbi:uncharacterized protein LOC124499944 [Dermatophagoides farinae]|uniref:uncharacterized protein LOC124499944 n=1 Tax=Dermatophagoides farinae TaxID=6954 RepID=UPI003F5E6FA8
MKMKRIQSSSYVTISIINRLIKLILSILIISMIDHHHNHNNQVIAFKFTDRFCNFTAYPKHGCEEPEFTTCIDKKCACRDESHFIIMGRFCTKKLCSNGEFYDAAKGNCVRQSKASADVTENHCRYDYHCFGQHVQCRQYGWNYNCVCDPGFRYDSTTQTCLPTYGIGGYCIRDNDCDETSLRKMYCDFKNFDQNHSTGGGNHNDDNGRGSNQHSSGTCQCQENHRYNYNIDGCEPLADIAEREHNMRTLVLLFVAAGLIFGLALTCNFSFFGVGPKHHELFLHQLKAEERIRQMKRDRLSRAENGQTFSSSSSSSSSPPISLNNNNNDDGKNLSMVDNDRQPQSSTTVTSFDDIENSSITIDDDSSKKSGPKTSLIMFG